MAATFLLEWGTRRVALQRVRLSARALTHMRPQTNEIGAAFERQSPIRRAASHQRPRCESDLSSFRLTPHFPLLAQGRRLARTNAPKSRHSQTASESLGGISFAKSRTVGLYSESQRPSGRRLFLPGWGAGIRTPEWRYQKPLPYHLATPQCRERAESYAIRARKATAGFGRVLTQFRPLWPRPAAAFCPSAQRASPCIFRRCASRGKPL